MALHPITRKDFIKSSAMLLASTSLASCTGMLATTQPEATEQARYIAAGNALTLKNVRLETGFEYDGEEVIGTKTGLFTIEIRDGKIKAIFPNNPKANALDAQGLLLLPAFKDMHIHLDKTFYGGPWQARRKKNRTVQDMIAYEQQVLPKMLPTSTERAEKLIELLQSHGVNFARSHVNIEPASRLDSLKNLQQALDNKKDSFDAELVAFPQHGILSSNSEQLMKEAATMGIDYIGGLDPGAVDGDMQKSMDFMVKLALDHKKGIDIHLHESGVSGLKTIEYLIDRVNENPVLKGKTFISHCFVLASLEKQKLEAVAEKLAAAEVGIISTIPIGKQMMPIPTLYKYGVDVRTGNDSIIDHWNTFGTGSILQKANLMAQLYGYSTEFELSRCLKLATHNILPLDDKGNRQWPQAGDKADLVLVDASCSAEAVSRVSPVRSLIHKGKIVYQTTTV
ncbi:amidohydrolase family protein [Pontibacter sp. BT310]|uniref:Amidohydrolase family protein n=1 Tax=Pontibacter populi TaxID=890055 RepID=A0ABS6XG25_9BACT|nr:MULTISPECIES: amidohydrolase family protein [Pontibacter]MBJ6119615.1 amidohydrolase family protein [Pontibacter sp. BT310]MBR0572042.1 amidohydrolase family protein [Microvirga sp. STS03]MBW3366468.1 amidohydrolase family protein [Pontibacter populi]